MLLALTGGLGGEGGLDPVTLMLLTQGEGDIDPLMLMTILGGDIDPVTMLLLSGGLTGNNEGEDSAAQPLDPVMLLALTGGLGGEGGLDPVTLMLLPQGGD